MKLQGRAARDWLRDPKGPIRLVLVSGADPVRVAQARARVLDAWVGPSAAAEMRLDRLSAAELRADPARLLDAVKAIGFFGGSRAVWVEDATDGLAPRLSEALDAWAEGDARIVATAGPLTAKGTLRSLAEGRRDAMAIALYDDPPTAAEIAADLAEAGLRPDDDARGALEAWAAALPPGEWAGLVERLALHEQGSLGALGAATVEALAPQAVETDVDDVVLALAAGQADDVARAVRRASAQRIGPVTLVIGVGRAIRAALGAQAGGGGGRVGGFGGPGRACAARLAESWTPDALDHALRRLTALDLALRSGGGVPPDGLVERELMALLRR